MAGCAASHQLALRGGWDITLVEAAPFLGAGVRTTWYGGHPHTFGPRHFLTQDRRIYEFLNKYLPLRPCPDHQFLTYIERDQQFYNFPIHKDDILRMPDRDQITTELQCVIGVAEARNLEEYWIGSVGRILYEKFINGYSKKMWMVDDNRRIDTFHWSPKGVALKEGPRAAWDTALSAYPYASEGYNSYFDIATAEATVHLSTRIEHYDIAHKTIVFKGERRRFDVIINTISPDILFDCVYGELPYIGRDLHRIVLPIEHCFPENVYFLYYANSEPFTRLVEYKKFTHHKAPSTLIGMEIPSMNGKHYPVPIQSEQAKARRYFAEMPDGVFSIGRAGSYDYSIDIDDCIRQAIEIAEAIASPSPAPV
ncbi:MAG: FAD-dependent oxidoreductase [Acidobacteria bacterium]|nr:FAD-dependent oxidoreductase [Acidobacteriota bacterium]